MMQQPTWYLPALADAVLIALDKDAANTVVSFQLLARFGEFTQDKIAEWQRAGELRALIEQEKVYRQTVRLAKLASEKI